jgi:hypothetical protein
MIIEEQECTNLLSNQNIKMTLWSIKIKPKFIINEQELTDIQYPLLMLCLNKDPMITEERESAHLSSNRNLKTTLCNIKIKPKFMINEQELTEIQYPLLMLCLNKDPMITEERESARPSSNRNLRTSLCDIKIKPKFTRNEQELTEIQYLLMACFN